MQIPYGPMSWRAWQRILLNSSSRCSTRLASSKRRFTTKSRRMLPLLVWNHEHKVKTMLRNLLEIRYYKSIKPNIRSIPSVSSMMMMPMLVNQIPASQKKTFLEKWTLLAFGIKSLSLRCKIWYQYQKKYSNMIFERKKYWFFRNLVEAQVAEDHFSFEQVKRCSPKHYSLYSF